MRIKFDPLSKEGADRLQELLKELGAPPGPPPQVKKEPGSTTDPVGIKEIQKRLSDFPLVREPNLSPPNLAPKKGARPSAPRPAKPSAPRPAKPSGPKTPPPKPMVVQPPTRPASSPRLEPVPLGAKPNDATMPARVADLAPVFGAPANEAPRLIVQVQGLLMQLGDLQQQLEAKDREVASLRQELSAKTAAFEKADRELKAAELAIQRLSMQLAARSSRGR
jgi:hypothetical protein